MILERLYLSESGLDCILCYDETCRKLPMSLLDYRWRIKTGNRRPLEILDYDLRILSASVGIIEGGLSRKGENGKACNTADSLVEFSVGCFWVVGLVRS
uniref:Uncharacterized protein n=1 Tax=Rhizophora mucronata TaxID=61149 RepID=A0A2P2IP71_RHIMU